MHGRAVAAVVAETVEGGDRGRGRGAVMGNRGKREEEE